MSPPHQLSGPEAERVLAQNGARRIKPTPTPTSSPTKSVIYVALGLPPLDFLTPPTHPPSP
jgi:hypothetical protein